MNKKQIAKKTLKFTGKVLKATAVFSLSVIANILSESAKEKKHEPTLEENMCGEKLPLSDEYFINEPKPYRHK